jgi:putative SOS response-associated peptidase YedK
MRRFVQAFSGYENFPNLRESMAASLSGIPDRYNIAVRKRAAVVVARDGHWQLEEMAWGLVPSWEKEPQTKYSTQTARLRHAPASKMYRRAWRDRRCGVPMNGYYKWDRERRPPWPYFIQSARGFILFAAGLWERWESDCGQQLDSFAVLTHPNEAIPRPLTPDGPVFLSPARLDDWLACDSRRALRVALGAPQPELEAYPVSRRIASRDVDDYTLLEPVTPTDEIDAEGAHDPDEADEADEEDRWPRTRKAG